MKKSLPVLFSLLLLAVTSSMAMSLGRHRGAALIGRPLDISVQTVLEAQDDLANLCLEADVFYSDNKLDKSRVRVTAEKTSAASQDAVIHIRSSTLVDEPVVSIYLRVGCQQKTERRYVVLADLVSEAASSPALSQTAGAAGSSAAALTATGSDTGRPSSSLSAGVSPNNALPASAPVAATSGRRSRSRLAASAARTASAGALNPPTVAQPSAAPEGQQATPARRGQRAKDLKDAKVAEKGRSRLKLEPLDLTIERDPQLKSSAELISAPASSEQERSAAAALWRALTAQPQDILRDAEKLQTLEASVRGLQAQTRKNQLAIDDLTGQLKKAESERYANALVYGLGALLLLVAAALVYFWRQGFLRRCAGAAELPWWRKNKPLEQGWADSVREVDDAASISDFEDKEKGVQKGRKSGRAPLDLDLDLGRNESNFTEVKHLSGQSVTSSAFAPQARDNSDFAMSMSHPARAVKAEELFDVQQQADFFVSLGQHEQAIEVLRSHIGDNVETSALVYLDLFNLYHQLKRRTDYEALRDSFNERFNAKIPVFELYSDTGPGLEAYQHALTRIEALWPSPKVLEIIEESIFRKPDADTQAFDLEAYRELLLLYAVAKEIINPAVKPVAGGAASRQKFDLEDVEADDLDFKPMKFMSTSIQPLSASMDEAEEAEEGRHSEPLLASVLPPASPRLGLDFDLSEPADPGKAASPEAESDAQFFAQFDRDAPVDLPVIPAVSDKPARAAPEVDNLIDFDAFDASVNGVDIGKPPKS